jgi:hypothetical protein
MRSSDDKILDETSVIDTSSGRASLFDFLFAEYQLK